MRNGLVKYKHVQPIKVCNKCNFLNRLALNELEMSPLFEGVDGNRIFTHNVQLLEENKYLIAGRLVALSFAQEGPSPRFFNEVLFDLMVGGKVNILEDLREKLGGILPEKMIEITEQVCVQSEKKILICFFVIYTDDATLKVI